MKKLFALCAVVSILGSTAALAAPPKKSKTTKPATKVAKTTKTAKVTDLWTCPITGEEIKDHKGAGKTEVVGNTRVHFCCGGCPEKFDAMSDKDKKAKIAELTKKEAPKKETKG